MELLKHTRYWVRGELLQGKVMISLGIAMLIIVLSCIRSQNELFKGMLIPLGVLIITNIAYGGYLSYSRTVHKTQIENEYFIAPQKTIESEIIKLEKDDESYQLMLSIYPILIIQAIMAVFFISTSYYKGLAMGCTLLFLTAYFIDSFLQYRLLAYLELLKR